MMMECNKYLTQWYEHERNEEMYQELLPFAKAHGVKIAAENMWSWDTVTDRASFAICATADSFCSLIDAVNDDYMVACLDIGHAEMMGDLASAEGLVRALGKRLKALHIHDNDRWKDLHQIPFSVNIDFKKVTDALKEIGYDGYLTIERECGEKPEQDIEKAVAFLRENLLELPN